MYNGSHAKANNKPRLRMNKLAILFIAVVMLIGAVVGSTVAFLVTETAPVENKFTYASISTNIKENFDGYCTEMEGAAIAQTAYLNQIPFVIIRAISDKADDSATMDYPTFEKQAVEHSVRLTRGFLKRIQK